MADALEQLDRAPLFTALTRPQMFAGVTYSYFIINAVIAAELFLVSRSIWVLPLALVIHGVGVLLCLREPRIIDLWLTRIGKSPARSQPQDLAMQPLPSLQPVRTPELNQGPRSLHQDVGLAPRRRSG